jgi:hypothetical protein
MEDFVISTTIAERRSAAPEHSDSAEDIPGPEEMASESGTALLGIAIGVAGPERRLAKRVRSSLLLLLQSHAYAQDLGEDLWEFAVEWCELQRLGLASSDGRWLVRKGLVACACETTTARDERRKFTPAARPPFSSGTCFVLTDEGLRVARRIARGRPVLIGQPLLPDNPVPRSVPARPERRARHVDGPRWDRDRRELRVDGHIVKKYRVPAPNQEIILAVFEEESWPPRVDDPLPPKPGVDSQRRLHDTINSLNRSQKHRLMRFFADGLGRGVGWELLAEPRGLGEDALPGWPR